MKDFIDMMKEKVLIAIVITPSLGILAMLAKFLLG